MTVIKTPGRRRRNTAPSCFIPRAWRRKLEHPRRCEMAQVNVVVPAPDADLVRRIGKGLREIEGFADALKRFLDGEAGISAAQRQTLARQVAEEVVAALAPMLASPEAEAPRRKQPPRKPACQVDMDV